MNHKIMLGMIITGAILIALLVHITVNEIREVGLKGIVNEIWCGEKGCD